MYYLVVVVLIAVVCFLAILRIRSVSSRNILTDPNLKGMWRQLSLRCADIFARRNNINTVLIHYDEYVMTTGQVLLSVLAASGGLGVIGFIFYKHFAGAFVISLAGLYYPFIRKKQLIRKRKEQLRIQFKQALATISSALGAGKSVETAFAEALSDVRLLYPDPRTMIVRELEMINRRIANGETIEYALKNLGDRAKVEDIEQFAEVFMVCKRTGGNLVHVIRRTASIIQDKLEIQQDIQVLMAQKRFESRVLTVAPLIVIALLSFSSPDYMEPLYRGTGQLIMTAALLVLIGCFALTNLIMNIKV